MDYVDWVENALTAGITRPQLDQRYLVVPAEMPPMLATAGEYTNLFVGYGLAVDGSSYQAETRTWYGEVRAAGGVVTTAEIQAVDTLIAALIAGGVWSLTYRLGLTVGDSLAAVSVPIKRSLGGTVDTFSNITEANYTRALGVAFGSLRAITTGINPSTQLTVGNSFIGSWTKSVTDGYTFGSTILSPRFAVRATAGTLRAYHGNGTTSVSFASANANTFLASDRATNALTMYFNGTSVATGTAGASSFAGLTDLVVGVPTVGPVGGYHRAYIVAQHLTAPQQLALYNALNALSTALGW